jgi:hypothetical protein
MEVGPEDFLVVVDYNELLKEEGDMCKLVLKQYPEEVKHVRMNPSEMEYIIEQKVGLR